MKSISLGKITDIRTGKLDVNAGDENGLYPFFTCAAKPYKINKYAFDNEAILVAGNGDLNVKYYRGKFNAYQRTYVIQNLSPKELSMKYLYYFMETYLYQLRRNAIGGIIKYIKLGNLTGAQIPLPPLDEQKRIVHLLGKVEGLIARRKQHLQQLDELLKSVFLEMFGDPVRNEKGWDTITLPQMVLHGKNSLKRGPFGGALKKEIFVESGYLIYEQNHALNNDYSFERYYITKDKYNELLDFKVVPNDILISCSGIYLGKLSIVPLNAKPGIINQALLKVSLNPTKIRHIFFVHVFGSPQFKSKYFPSNRGGAIPNLPPMTEMKKIPFISPPIELQNQFAIIVKKVESLKARYQSSLFNLENLYGALSQKAFKGELDLGRVPLSVEEEHKEITLRDYPLNTAVISKDFIKAMEICGKQINEMLRIPAEVINQYRNEIRRINGNINLVSKSFARMIPEPLVQSLAQMNRLTNEAIKPIKLNSGFVQQLNTIYNTMNKALESPFMKGLIQKAAEILEPWSEEYICGKIKAEFENKHFTIQEVLNLTAILYEVPSSYDPYQVIRPVEGKKNEVIGLRDLFERALLKNYKCYMRVEQVYENIGNKDFKQVLLKVVA